MNMIDTSLLGTVCPDGRGRLARKQRAASWERGRPARIVLPQIRVIKRAGRPRSQESRCPAPLTRPTLGDPLEYHHASMRLQSSGGLMTRVHRQL